MYQVQALSISLVKSNTMIDNNGCHPQRLLSVCLCTLCDTSMCQGVLNLFYMKKVFIRSLYITVYARKIEGGSWQSITTGAIWSKEDVIELA